MMPAEVVLAGLYGSTLYESSEAGKHHTSEYELLRINRYAAIFRRGFDFTLSARLTRFNAESDVIRVGLQFGEPNQPKKKDITDILLLLRPDRTTIVTQPSGWGIGRERIVVRPDKAKDVMMNIRIPANAPVGKWRCTIYTNIKGIPETKRAYPGTEERKRDPLEFYVLFNPWSPDDDVYMQNEVERDEYVRNESGKVWLGTWWNPQGRHWIYGQFDEIALRTATLLLDKSKLTPELRGDPVAVARTISAMVNSDDDNGLLVANWDGNYTEGTSPYAWTGTKAILDEYNESGPVRYGLCWVFSAATVTVCRALGLPCRSTTVYDIAEGTKYITKSYDAFGKLVENGSSSEESLWNFHSWNDVWMKRSDLGEAFGGWQIIDSTPQRHSDGYMICGPASTAAVRQQHIGYQYNTDFVYNKLNADVKFVALDGEAQNYTTNNRYQSGRRAVTKTPGPSFGSLDIDSLDITNLYKPQTDNETSFGITKRSLRGRRNTTTYFDFDMMIDRVPYGDTLNLSVKVTNKSPSERSIRYILQARSVHYNGAEISDGLIKSEDETVWVAPGERTFTLSISAKNYIPKLVELGIIKFYVYFEDVATNELPWVYEDSYIFNKVRMAIDTDADRYRVGDNAEMIIRFKNPLNAKLTNCFYMVEGSGGGVPRSVKYPEVQSLAEVSIPVSYPVGDRAGVKRIVANFTSQQLPNVNGSTDIEILEKKH